MPRALPGGGVGPIAYTSQQIGHPDSTFTLRVYTSAVKRRQRLTGAELEQSERAIEWGQWAPMGTHALP